MATPLQVGSEALSAEPRAIHPYPVIWPWAWPELNVTLLPLAAGVPPVGVPVLPPPLVPAGGGLPPLPPLSLLAQDVANVANIARATHSASEVKAKLTFTIVLFVAFMSPSRLVFVYSIAEAPDMGKDI